MRRTLALCLVLACKADDDAPSGDSPAVACEAPTPSAEATVRAGANGDAFVLPGGRTTTPVGVTTEVGGFPAGVLVHPTAGVAYVANTGNAFRALQVIDLADGSLVEEHDRANGFVGFALTDDGSRLYAGGGGDHRVEVWDVGSDGRLIAGTPIPLEGYAGGMALVGDTLWVAEFVEGSVVSVDLPTGLVGPSIPVGSNPWEVVAIPGTTELYVSLFGGTEVVVIDTATESVAARIPVPSDPEGLAVAADGSRVWVAVSDGDRVDAIDTELRTVVASASVGGDVRDENGLALPGSNVVDVAVVGDRLYVARAADNAIAVLGADALEDQGSFPVGWYPTAVGAAPDGTLVVTNGKGVGTGPYLTDAGGSGASQMSGSVTVIDPATLDLAQTSTTVAENNRRPSDVYPFTCEGTFPLPRRPGDLTPIEHVVLLVRENKTYDALLGDLDMPEAEGDPDLVMYGEDITPNLHALAHAFTSHDNFYNDSEVSHQGHMWLTSAIIDDFLERTWLEDGRGGASFAVAPALPAGTGDWGSLFTHLMVHGVSYRNFGEGTSIDGVVGDDSVFAHTDFNYPGVLFNLDVPDEERANYLVETLIDQQTLPSFVFAILPRDHTYGTSGGRPTPESMVADNDRATGLFIEALSKSSYWDSTVVFVVEDDPQDGFDHIDYHRSILMVASPYAKRGHTSHAHADYPSLLHTIELLLGVPPMNRWTAQAAPLWDAFTSVADTTPFTSAPRTVPDGTNARTAVGGSLSDQMDFTGPDRNPDLPAVLWWARKGSPPAGSRVARIAAGEDLPLRKPVDDDDDHELDELCEREAFRVALGALCAQGQ